jgi:hypothetical protein
VAGVFASRALILLDDGAPATVWEELTVPEVPLDRVLAKGQPVLGVHDPVSRRLDLRRELLHVDAESAGAAVRAAYRAGDVVLADVVDVSEDAVSLRPVPGLTVAVQRSAVTSNPNDTLCDLFTVGEVVACRIAAMDPLRLRLDDIDDDDRPERALSLLPGGPPWLRLAERAPQPAAAPPPEPAPPAPAPVPVQPAKRPSPLDFARKPAPDPLSTELEAVRARAADLEAERDRANATIARLQTRYRVADLARQHTAKKLKALQAKADRAPGDTGPAFVDPEQQFRHEVYCEWVARIPAADKPGKGLAEYQLGADFLESVEKIDGVSRDKIVAVVVEVLTGQAPHLPGRDAHQLRTGDAGSRYVSRADGATCWRVALQQDTAAARRLHYWRIRDRYELSRVVLHDNFRP